MTGRRRRRPSSRQDKRRERGSLPYVQAVQPLLSKLPPYRILSEEGVETIHQASIRLLKEFGVLVLDYPPALEILKANGAIVEGDLVKIDEHTLMHFLWQTPAGFTLLARNPANNLPIGGRHTVFAPVYGPPSVSDLDNGRRDATMKDFENFVKLTYMAPYLHHGGGTLVEPNDIPVGERHLDMLLAHITLNDKSFMGNVTHPDNAMDTVTMSEILYGAEVIRQTPATISLINVSSPLRFDDRMLSALQVYAKARQAVIISPFIVAGAMSPSTLAATLAQLNAEVLFGIALAQMFNSGTPCVYGAFTPNIDLKTGAPSFGTPSNALILYGGAQMAARYGLPFRSGGNFTASRIPDAQAGYESAGSIWPAVQAGANFVLHAAGWLEGGMIAGYEKFILDLELCGMMTSFVEGIGLTEEDFAWDAFAEAGPGQHFLGTQHTMRHYTTAFYQPFIFNTDNYGQWVEKGALTTYQQANIIWKRILNEYTPPPLDEAIAEELQVFAAQRRTEIQTFRPRTEWKR